ncbi:hypothetical protein [Streptomyces scabiei]|uniref:hypothetical protein n=1 Tax=Streptomyces scabiei TaxID=1930 RepID=UPI001F21C14C|nr:hypothetical protein [Streptomyces scabiei]
MEGQDAAQFVVVDGAQGGDLAASQVQAVDTRAGSGGQPVAQVRVGDDGDEDLVVGEQPEIDGVGEVEVVGDGPKRSSSSMEATVPAPSSSGASSGSQMRGVAVR